MKKLFYARTSTKEQNEQRQLDAAKELGLTRIGKNVFLDKQTGTNFKRPQYEKLIEKLEDISEDNKERAAQGKEIEQVILYVHELDRFGRDYVMIKNQIAYVESLGVEIEFLDMPVIKTGDSLTDKLLRDQFINTLSYVAQKETEKRKTRQREGIDCMPKNKEGKRISAKTGNAMGRPKAVLPKDFEKIYTRVQAGELTTVEAQKLLDIKKTSYFKYAKILKESKMKDQMPGQTYLLAD